MGVFEHPFFCKKEEKLKGDHLETFKKICEKVSQRRNILHKKFFGQGRPPSHVLLLSRPRKIRSRRSYISVAVSGSQLIKLMKSVTSLILKKVNTIVCVFLRKAPTKIRSVIWESLFSSFAFVQLTLPPIFVRKPIKTSDWPN